MENTGIKIIEWLNARGISNDVISQFQIHADATGIVIPVFDFNGTVLFNKYRRFPWSEEGPKYRYDAGATSQLYGIETMQNATQVMICEGELDALLLRSHGFCAVSTTGGSGTFRKEWAHYFLGKDVFILYDKDMPGTKGAFMVQALIPHAKIVFIPEAAKGKDVTEIVQAYGIDFIREAMNESISYPMVIEPELPPEKKKDLLAVAKEYGERLDQIQQAIQVRRQMGVFTYHLEVLNEQFLARYDEYNRRAQFFTRKFTNGPNRMDEIKKIPIERFIQFNILNKAKCIWHDEDTPSMQLYRDTNRVHCFGCSHNGDVIDVVMQLKGLGMTEAINFLLQ